MSDVMDSDRLGMWLKGKPPEFACLLAVRAALRIVPVLEYALHEAEEDRRQAVILPSFRALAAASFGSAWPRHRSEARDAARSAGNAARDAIGDLANGAQLAVFEAKDAMPEIYQYIWELETDSRMLGIAERAVSAIGFAAQAVVDAIDSEQGIAGSDAVYQSAVSAATSAESAISDVHGDVESFTEPEEGDDSKPEIAEHISEFWRAVELDAECLETAEGSRHQHLDILNELSERALWLNGTSVWAGRVGQTSRTRCQSKRAGGFGLTGMRLVSWDGQPTWISNLTC